MGGYNVNDPDMDGDNDLTMGGDTDGDFLPSSMGKNGVISNGNTPNAAGPAMAKPESKGNFARKYGPLVPKSAP